MMVAVGTVYMAMRNFFFARSTHFKYLKCKTQGLAGQGMVAVEMHLWALDLDDSENDGLTVFSTAFKLSTDFDAWRKLGFGNGLQEAFVVLSKGVDGGQLDCGGKASSLAFEGLFNLGEGVAVTAVEVGDRFLALIQQFASSVGNLELQSDCGVFSDVHVPNYRKKPCPSCA
jgi:hypothetical protein